MQKGDWNWPNNRESRSLLYHYRSEVVLINRLINQEVRETDNIKNIIRKILFCAARSFKKEHIFGLASKFATTIGTVTSRCNVDELSNNFVQRRWTIGKVNRAFYKEIETKF